VRDHFFGYAGHRELEIFVRLGMTPLQAIHAATGLAAQHLGLTDTGTLTAGKRADFVVLDASPLDDIRHTRRIQAVFLGGVAFDREAFQQAARQAQSGAQSPQ
jgi:imidazolonepropionase-like amidohydrolase